MFKDFSNSQLMVIFLGSKVLLEKDSRHDMHDLLISLSKELKYRRHTRFRGWKDFSEPSGINPFAMQPYKNHSICAAFSKN